MPIQFQTFTPTDQKHYTLAETQSEKEAEMSRQMARDAANNAAQASTHAMSLDAANAQHAATLDANTKQAAVENNLNQQRVNADNNRVGLANAREMERNKATVAQNAIDNRRQAFADQNTLQQQGLSNTRNAIADQQATDKFNLEKEALLQKKAITDKHLALGELGLTLATSKPDANGEIDLTNHKNTLTTLGLTDNLTKHDGIKSRNVDGKTELYGIDKNGSYQAIMHNNSPVRLTNDVLSTMSDFYAKQLGIKADGDYEVVHSQQFGPDGTTLVKTPEGILNKKTGVVNPYKSPNQNNELDAFKGSLPVNQSIKDTAPTVTTETPQAGLASTTKPTQSNQLPLGDQINNLGNKVTLEDRDAINNAPQSQKADIAQRIINRINKLGY